MRQLISKRQATSGARTREEGDSGERIASRLAARQFLPTMIVVGALTNQRRELVALSANFKNLIFRIKVPASMAKVLKLTFCDIFMFSAFFISMNTYGSQYQKPL